MIRSARALTLRTVTVGLGLGLGLSLAITGCNHAVPDTGADPGEHGARETADGLVTGLAAKDGALACSLMDADAMKSLNARTKRADCLGSVEAMGTSHPEIASVSVDGETATVSVADGAPAALPGPWHLVRESGHWVLHSAG